MKNNKKLIANIALFLVAIIWGGGFVAGKMALTGSTPFVVIAYRFCIAAIITFIIFFKKIIHCNPDTVKKGLLIGIIEFAALAVQLTGLQYTTSAKQSFLCTAYVAMVPFISWIILKQKVKGKEILSGFIALIGIGLISLEGSLSIGLGDSLSLGFALLFGIQIVLIGKFVNADTDAFVLTFFEFVSAGVLSFLVCIIRGDNLILQGNESFIGVAYLILFNTVVAFLVQNTAQRFTTDTLASLILSFESLFGFALSIIYYHEKPTIKFFIGAVLCFAAILINSYKKNKVE